MEQFFDTIINHLLPQQDGVLYLFLFASAIVENLFPPIPGDTITAFGAFLVGTGRLSYPLVYLATTAGSVIGFMLLVFIGRLMEREFFIKRNFKFFSADSIVSAEKWFSRYGFIVVLLNRFLPGIRSVISLVSGLTRLNFLKVFIFSVISASIWNLIWIQVGFLLGNNWQAVKENMMIILQRYNLVAGTILGITIACFIVYRVVKKKRARSSSSE